MNSRTPEDVIKWCQEHKLCRGCPINCVAPVGQHNYENWFSDKIKQVKQLIEKGKK